MSSAESKLAVRIERDVLVADADAAAVGGDVLRLQLGVDLLLVDAELREPLPRDFEEHDFLLLARTARPSSRSARAATRGGGTRRSGAAPACV